MSFNIYVIPEDYPKDEKVLKPILEKLVQSIRKSAKLLVCRNPRLGGISQALKWERIEEIIQAYPMVDCFLLIVDRDGSAERRAKLSHLETRATEILGERRLFFAENAHQEVEAWVLAGMTDLPTEWSWNEIREEVDVKEVYFGPYVKQRALEGTPAGGRKKLGKEAARNYSRIRKLCPEIQTLEDRLRAAFG